MSIISQIEERDFEVVIQSDIQRKIKILNIIAREEKWYTFEGISDNIKASTKTISRDLAFIKDYVPTAWEIKIQKGYGVKLTMPKNASIEEVICKLFRESLTFQIIDYLFKFNGLTVFSLADKLYIQPYMVSRALKKVEKDIAYFGLRLQRKPLKIIGNDLAIIHMFTELYAKAYVCSDWPFKFNQRRINDFIEQMENDLSVLLDLSSRRKFAYFIAIFFIRKQQGEKFRLSHELSTLNIETPIYNKISRVLDKISNHFNIVFNIEDKIIFTIAFKSLYYKHKNPSKEKKMEIQIFHERKLPVYNLVREFIEMLDKRLELSLIHDEEFIYALIVYFREKIFILQFYPFIRQRKEINNRHVEKKFLKTFLQVKEVYVKWAKKNNIANYIPDKEVVNILLQIKAHEIIGNIKPKKVVIITKEGDSWKRYISAILKKKFSDKISILSESPLSLSRENEIAAEKSIDFIISTLPINTKIPVVQIQPIVTKRDLSNVEYYIDI